MSPGPTRRSSRPVRSPTSSTSATASSSPAPSPSVQNQAAGNTTTYNQPSLASFNLTPAWSTPTSGRPSTAVASRGRGLPGRHQAVRRRLVQHRQRRHQAQGRLDQPDHRRDGRRLHRRRRRAGTELDATNTTVYFGGRFTTVNGTARGRLAAVDATTGCGRHRLRQQHHAAASGQRRPQRPGAAAHPRHSKLIVVHTGRQIDGQDRYGVGIIDTATKQLLPWRTRLWDDNLQFVGGIQRAYRRRHRAGRLVLRRLERLRRRPPADQRHGGRLPDHRRRRRPAAVDLPLLRQRLLRRHLREGRLPRRPLRLERVPDRPGPVAGSGRRRLRHRPGPLGLRPRRRRRQPRPHRRDRPGLRQGARVEPGVELLRGQQGHARHPAWPHHRR